MKHCAGSLIELSLVSQECGNDDQRDVEITDHAIAHDTCHEKDHQLMQTILTG